MKKPTIKRITYGIGVLFLLIQFIPVHRTNPKATGEIDAPAAVKAILRRSCYDCHSGETHWPKYSYVAPISWLVIHDVNDGRDNMNFSAWTSESPESQAELKGHIIDEVTKGDMPLREYLPLHPDARLSAEDIKTLRAWVDGVRK